VAMIDLARARCGMAAVKWDNHFFEDTRRQRDGADALRAPRNLSAYRVGTRSVEVWKHEAQDFTLWPQNNIEVLNETLHFKLTGADLERAAGVEKILVARNRARPVLLRR